MVRHRTRNAAGASLWGFESLRLRLWNTITQLLLDGPVATRDRAVCIWDGVVGTRTPKVNRDGVAIHVGAELRADCVRARSPRLRLGPSPSASVCGTQSLSCT